MMQNQDNINLDGTSSSSTNTNTIIRKSIRKNKGQIKNIKKNNEKKDHHDLHNVAGENNKIILHHIFLGKYVTMDIINNKTNDNELHQALFNKPTPELSNTENKKKSRFIQYSCGEYILNNSKINLLYTDDKLTKKIFNKNNARDFKIHCGMVPIQHMIDLVKTIRLDGYTNRDTEFKTMDYNRMHTVHDLEYINNIRNLGEYGMNKTSPKMEAVERSIVQFLLPITMKLNYTVYELRCGVIVTSDAIHQPVHLDIELKSNEVVYMLWMPLCKEGSIYRLMDQDFNSHFVFVPFGSFIVLPTNVWHAGVYGSKGNVRLYVLMARNDTGTGSQLTTLTKDIIKKIDDDNEREELDARNIRNYKGLYMLSFDNSHIYPTMFSEYYTSIFYQETSCKFNEDCIDLLSYETKEQKKSKKNNSNTKSEDENKKTNKKKTKTNESKKRKAEMI